MTIFRPLGLAGLTAGLVLLVSPTFAQPNDEASDTFDRGVELLQRGREEEALKAFQKVLAMDLSNDAAYELWKSTDSTIWLEMLSAEGDLELVTRRLMSMAKTNVVERRDDADVIRGLLSTVSNGDITERMLAVRSLSANHGEFAVQYMLTSLNDQASADHRVLFMQALTSMGDDVVLPLCAALDSPDAMLRRNVALVLGRVGDGRAAAFLALCAETDADGGVKAAAADALAKCGGAPRGAAYAFGALGNGYHMASQKVLRPDQFSSVVWSFQGGKLVASPVPSYLYAQEMAKVAFYNALRVDPSSTPALSGLVRTLATEMQIIADRSAAGIDAGDEAAAVQAGMLAVATAGPGAVDSALERSLVDGDTMAAVGICRAVQTGMVSASSGLTSALDSTDSVVRTEAALAIASQTTGANISEKAVAILGKAAGRPISRIVGVIDADMTRAMKTVGALEGQNMMVNHWATGAKGLANLYRIPGLDVILVADSLPDMTTDQVVTEIQESSRFENTPVLVVANAADIAEELYGSRVAGIVSGDDLSVVHDALSEVSLGRNRQRADALSRRSSAALSQLASQGASVSGALTGLSAAISNDRPDVVTLPALEALGRVGGADQAAMVATLAGNASASANVRKAAAMACATMFSRGVDGGSSLEALHGVVNSDAPLGVRSAAAGALGRLNLTPEIRVNLLKLVRANVGE